MRIQHNIMAMNAYRNYNNNTSKLSKNLEKLSSGYKINRAGDDAAGLAISEKMRAQITGLTQAQANAKSGINLVQTAEGALQEVHDMLNRMVKLADQSANGIYTDKVEGGVDRQALQEEVDALKDEINRISQASNFNSKKLLDGSLGGAKVTTTAAVPANPGAGGTPAKAAVYELDLSAASFGSTETLTFNGVTITEGTTTGVAATNTAKQNADAIAAAFEDDGAFDDYDIAVDATGKITFTATTAGVDTNKDNMIAATTGDVVVTPTEKTAGAAEVPGTGGTPAVNAKTEIDFTNRGGDKMLGGKMEIGGVTYEFVENATDVTAGNTAVVISKGDTGAQVATKLAAAFGGNTLTVGGATYTVTDDTNGKLTLTAGAATDAALEVKQSGVGLTLQIGDTAEDFNKITVSVDNMSTAGLKIADIDISSETGAADAVKKINDAIDIVSTQRGKLGAVQNRLEHTINNLSVMTENIQDAESTIRDTDVADEMMAYTKNNILIQSAQAMLAQANQVPQGVLQLLQ